MHNIIIISSYILALLFIGSVLITLWKRAKSKLFQEQVKIANENVLKYTKQMQDAIKPVFKNIKVESDKKYMELQLRNKLDRDCKITDVYTDTISQLIKTGMSEKEAREFIKK